MPKDLEHAAIFFVALPIAKDEEVKLAEKWLRWRFADKLSLNKEKPPASEPKISAKLYECLLSTFEKEIIKNKYS